MKFGTILLDPPYPETMLGKWKKHKRPNNLPYPSMSLDEIRNLPVPDLADVNSHLWLWTTNRTLEAGFDILRHWGFRYLSPITWVKPSGFGAWFVSRTQTMLFGYRGKLEMMNRFKPNVLFAPSRKHSQKPECSYELIESVSPAPRLEMFARVERPGWTTIGNGIDGEDIMTSLAIYL